MKKVFSAVIVVLSLWCVLGRAQDDTLPARKPAVKPASETPVPVPRPAPARPAPAGGAQTQSGTKRIVDFEADVMRPIKLPGDSTALSLQGKVVFFHNGAVIQCDSAVRYSDKRMECFNNVVINQKTTYVYGDRADYNGELNLARVYAPVVKIVDEDVVMYTYNFSFNTLTNIGEFWGGGTVRQNENLLESQRGYYYSEERRAVCVDRAELRNDEYRMRSDSLSYDMNTEQAEFYVLSYIWNQGGEILSARRGTYVKADSAYRFTNDAYLINAEQELWSDTLNYNSRSEDAELWSNIQIRDEEHSVISFGDHGIYWGSREEAMLTRDPQALSFDPDQKEDTLYVRADSMFLYTVSREAGELVQQIAEQNADEELIAAAGRDLLPGIAADSASIADMASKRNGISAEPSPVSPVIGADSTSDAVADLTEIADSLGIGVDSLATTSINPDTLTVKELRELEKDEKRLEREARIAERTEEYRAKIAVRDSIQKAKDEQHELRIREREQARNDRARENGKETEELPSDEDHGDHSDHTGHDHAAHADTTETRVDSLAALIRADSILAAGHEATDSLLTHGKPGEEDSLVRVIRAYRDVRMFRTDFQAVCDSLVAFSIDSTAHMYIDPVMWNGLNQVKSDVIDLYSKNRQLTRVVYTGTPIMSSQVDTTRYNQIKGLEIVAHLRDNEIFRTDVNGNGQTLYYMTEKDSLGYEDVVGFMVAECANISFDFEEQQVIRITYKGNPDVSVFPMDKIPEDQPQTLPGFVWEIERKPAMEDVFTRTVRPSQREEYMSMPQPSFPLTDNILKHRDQMIKDGVWRERNDVLGEHALLFIRSLGY